jgi:hypothetical protein
VRLLEEDAKWIYTWAEPWLLSKPDQNVLAYGTPVIIFGNYEYGEKAPWQQLAADAGNVSISVPEIDELLTRYLATISARVRARESVIAQTGLHANQVVSIHED